MMVTINSGMNTNVATKNSKVGLSSPWVEYYKELTALFGDDPEIDINYDEDDIVVRMYVDGQEKAEALNQLLPNSVSFGNVSLTISVIPANKEIRKIDLLKKAFAGNPAFVSATSVEVVSGNPIHYFAFKPEVVQYFDDNLHDLHGNRSTLYEQLAREVIGESDGVCFCTQSKKPVAVG